MWLFTVSTLTTSSAAVESQTREHTKAIGDDPFELADRRSAGVPERQELIVAVTVEQPRRGRRSRRRQQEAGSRRPLVDRLRHSGIDIDAA